jgi:hypothetical protein
MNSIANLYKVKWMWLSAVVVMFAIAYGVSVLLGEDARNSCFWAVVVNGTAGCGGIAPVVYAMLLRPSVSAYYVLTTSAMRLLLAVAGSGIILFFIKISMAWFAVWVVTLYLAVLIFEVGFVAQMLIKRDEVGKN